ncbi:hypothetical protein CYMTET_41385 [Cymbomonas tetramitiformis]|uniref:Uncharacterized protein n=1 Tax=Cymbomonas tetramitiformis TaxID=36881 RepID=A0AAE0C692_9CHLO|nr:hypothetical protein CYMTET_41385 [Cymbomonas tetramitiformis]
MHVDALGGQLLNHAPLALKRIMQHQKRTARRCPQCNRFFEHPGGNWDEEPIPEDLQQGVHDRLAFKLAPNKRKLCELFANGEPCFLEDLERTVQRLLPQVLQLPENVIIQHITRVHQETRKRVIMNQACLFETVILSGFENVFFVHDMVDEVKVVERLKNRWTKDIKKRAERCEDVHAAFKATYPAAGAAVGEPREPRARRTTRTKKSMAEPSPHMIHVLQAGRKALIARTHLTPAMRKKQRMTELTAAGVEELEEWSHDAFGEEYAAVQEDGGGTERELVVMVGKECFEHDTPLEWRALGHPEVMRCHCIGVDEDYDDQPARAAMDYSIFHSDFSVEAFDFDTLVAMKFVRLSDLSITEDYHTTEDFC